MANPATWLQQTQATTTLRYLGPAKVVSTRPGRATLELDGGETVEALLALPMRYRPVLDDILLVIGTERFYAIAVIEGHGANQLEVHGDLELRAIDGKVEVSGDQGVSLRGPVVDVVTKRWRVMADVALQKVNSLAQRVTGLWSVQAGSSQTAVDGEAVTKAKNATVLTEETMTINGKRIHLG